MENSYLAHYGIKGQKWGVRRWQNVDGTFNSAGKNRYFGQGARENYRPVNSSASVSSKPVFGGMKKAVSKVEEAANEVRKAAVNANSTIDDIRNKIDSIDVERAKKIAKGAAIGVAVVGGTVLAAKGSKYVKGYMDVAKPRLAELKAVRYKESWTANTAHELMKDLPGLKAQGQDSLYKELRGEMAEKIGLDPHNADALRLIDKLSTFSSSSKNNRAELLDAYEKLMEFGGNKEYAKKLLKEAATGRSWDSQIHKVHRFIPKL